MQFAKKDNHRELKQVLDVQKQCFPPSIQTETESRGPELLIISANDAVNFEYGNIAFRRTNLIKQQQKQLKRKKNTHSHIRVHLMNAKPIFTPYLVQSAYISSWGKSLTLKLLIPQFPSAANRTFICTLNTH